MRKLINSLNYTSLEQTGSYAWGESDLTESDYYSLADFYGIVPDLLWDPLGPHGINEDKQDGDIFYTAFVLRGSTPPSVRSGFKVVSFWFTPKKLGNVTINIAKSYEKDSYRDSVVIGANPLIRVLREDYLQGITFQVKPDHGGIANVMKMCPDNCKCSSLQEVVCSVGVKDESIVIVEEDGGLKARLSNGRKSEIKILPESASEKAKEVLELVGFTVELKEVGNKLKYEAYGEKPARLFGILPIKGRLIVYVDAESGDVKINRPWWAFLASGI